MPACPFLTVWDVGMDRLREFLEAVRTHGIAQGNLRGLLHILIGVIDKADWSRLFLKRSIAELQ